MQQYDTVLKSLLLQSAPGVLQQLTGTRIDAWIPTELPVVQNLRLDLLGRTADGGLVHLELQRHNDVALPFHMLEYSVVTTRVYKRVPQQIVLYIGPEPLRMPDHIHGHTEWRALP